MKRLKINWERCDKEASLFTAIEKDKKDVEVLK